MNTNGKRQKQDLVVIRVYSCSFVAVKSSFLQSADRVYYIEPEGGWESTRQTSQIKNEWPRMNTYEHEWEKTKTGSCCYSCLFVFIRGH